MDPFTFAFAMTMLVASYAMMPKVQAAETPKPASLEDFDFPQIEEGTPQGVAFGDVWVTSWIILWYGNMRTSKIKSKGGKK